MNPHPTNDPSANTAASQELSRRALAIGPSGPAIPLPTAAERAALAARASAENFNPYHDELGRFTTGSDATGPHAMRIDVVSSPQPLDEKVYQGKLSAGAYVQASSTGECLIACMHEGITQVETTRTKSDEPRPLGADSSMRALMNSVKQYGESIGLHFDFSQANKGYGAAIQDGLPTLSEKFDIHSEPITIEQIPEALRHGPVMVAAYDNGMAHGELILGMDKDRMGKDIPGSYRVYNPRHPVANATTLDASKIVRDKKGRPVLFALRPYRKGEKTAKASPTSSRTGGKK